MKVLFVGPSLAARTLTEPQIRGPAVQGDLIRATLEGATAIGLVDGRFEDVASVWHKEILFALAEGVQVFGAASMGALRAAECADFGMIGIGTIYQRYVTGDLDDDAAVAQLHAPADLGYAPVTEALVNVGATLANLSALSLIDSSERAELSDIAAELHFKERTYSAIVAAARSWTDARRHEVAAAIKLQKIDLKQRDAEQLLMHLSAAASNRTSPIWKLSRTNLFEASLQHARRSSEANQV